MAHRRLWWLWPQLVLSAALLAMFVLGLVWATAGSGCPGRDGNRVMTTLGGQCAVLVPTR